MLHPFFSDFFFPARLLAKSSDLDMCLSLPKSFKGRSGSPNLFIVCLALRVNSSLYLGCKALFKIYQCPLSMPSMVTLVLMGLPPKHLTSVRQEVPGHSVPGDHSQPRGTPGAQWLEQVTWGSITWLSSWGWMPVPIVWHNGAISSASTTCFHVNWEHQTAFDSRILLVTRGVPEFILKLDNYGQT